VPCGSTGRIILLLEFSFTCPSENCEAHHAASCCVKFDPVSALPDYLIAQYLLWQPWDHWEGKTRERVLLVSSRLRHVNVRL